MILFTAKISSKHQEKLTAKYPNQNFIFSDNQAEIEQYISEAVIIVTFGSGLTADLIKRAGQLEWIMVLSAGLENLPLKEIEEKEILVTNTRGIHKIPMAEYAISMLLQVYRQGKVIMKNEQEHTWDKSVRMKEITDKTILIAGTGAIGQEVARLAKAFNMRTIGISRSGKPVDFFDENYAQDDIGQLLPKADFVVSVLPSTNETKGFFTYEHFQQLPAHAVFLNMGRGNVVPSEVLLKAILNKEIAHAVLDVFEEEPLPEDHAFWHEENITITPHISGVSPVYMVRALEIFEPNLDTFLSGKGTYINEIDPARGY